MFDTVAAVASLGSLLVLIVLATAAAAALATVFWWAGSGWSWTLCFVVATAVLIGAGVLWCLKEAIRFAPSADPAR